MRKPLLSVINHARQTKPRLIALSIIVSILTIHETAPARTANTNPQDFFLSAALGFRAKSILNPEMIVQDLAKMRSPILDNSDVSPKTREALWAAFFGNTIVKVGKMPSAAPVALYYHPLSDIAVLTEWQRVSSQRYEIKRMAALPGEVFRGDTIDAADSTPHWLLQTDPIGSLRFTTKQTMERFSSLVPIGSTNPDSVLPESSSLDPKHLVYAELRLLGLTQGLALAADGTFSQDLAPIIVAIKGKSDKVLGQYSNIPEEFWSLNTAYLSRLSAAAVYPTNDGKLLFMSTREEGRKYLVIHLLQKEAEPLNIGYIILLDVEKRM